MFTFRRKNKELYAPVNGCSIALDDVRDEVFQKTYGGWLCIPSRDNERMFTDRQ